jgi:alpha-glucosidase
MAKGNFKNKFENYKVIFGEEIANESLSYARRRDELDKKNLVSTVGRIAKNHLRLINVRVGKDSVMIDFDDCILKISSVLDNVLWFTWAEKNEIRPKYREELSDKLESSSAIFIIKQSKNEIQLNAGKVRIVIHKDGKIEYEMNGKLIRTDFPPLISKKKLLHESLIRSKSRLHGTGERALPFDLRGEIVTLWNHDPNGSYGPGTDPIYISIPQIIDIEGDTGYGIEYMNPTRGLIDLCKQEENLIRVEFTSGQLEYYITFGNMQEILERLSRITGLPMLPPRWSFGFHQSKYSYMNTKQIEDVAAGFKRFNLRISAIHMDIDYMNQYRVFTVNRDTFPDINGLSERLKRQGIRLVTILDPAIKWDENYLVFKEVMRNGGYVKDSQGNPIGAPVWAGKSVFPDYSSDSTRRWWGSLYSFFEKNGISGVWHDMNEPVAFSLWGDNSLPLSALHEKGTHSEIHNLYALFMAKAGYEGLTKGANGPRPFILSRSGWSGIQRYSFVWTGDTESTWEELKQTIPTILNLSLSGIPYSGVDIGGFSGSPARDLFLRWFQLGAFLPLFRVHSAKGTRDREPWTYGKEVLDIARKFIEIRYSLIPYWYSIAFESHKTGHPLIRPISYHYPGTYSECAFMVGESILVYPVLEERVNMMKITLPPGKWYSFWDSSLSEGEVEEEIVENRIPVYIREGSIIPREGENLRFDIYPSADFSFTYYSDDDKIKQNFRTIKFIGRSDRGSFSIEYEQGGSKKEVEKISFTLKNPDYVFSENNKREISVTKKKGKVEVNFRSR